ncbi:MAG: hypothetical protein DYH12_22530 [Sorangiineae bacterium PRO1]|nr:hypothetical protein [Sorangiineae bacterium PRO1]
MLAPMLRLDPTRPPAAPRDAATVVVVRPGGPGLELFCVKRHAASGFLGGAVVFPGGKVSPADRAPAWERASTPLGPRAASVAPDPVSCRAFAIAALRELFEEAGILPLAGASLDDTAVENLRGELAARTPEGSDGSREFLELLAERGLILDTAALEAMARWITPAAEERRYDTRFYVLCAPAGQSGRHDEHETTHSFWATPSEILEAWEKDEIFLAPPTVRTVQLLARANDVETARAIARRQPLEPVCPFFAMDGDAAVLALPGDPLYPEPAAPPADADAPTRFVLRDGRFVPERVAQRPSR